MGTLAADSDEAKRIDASLREWRQGDLALEESWFVHVGDGAAPLSEAATESGHGPQALTSEVLGLVMLTQTCDIVRRCVDRPFVEVAPLIRVKADVLEQVRKGRRPSLATLPTLAKDGLVADLDRIMTVEKSIVSNWQRTPGFSSDKHGREFAQALARKRARFAFPDDFTSLVRKLQSRLGDKHDKNTEEGRALRALREIRVCASPAWDGTSTEIFFWFIRNDADVMFEGKSWSKLLENWLALVPAAGRFTRLEGQVVTLQEMTAEDYVHSDPLDLDHLSTTASE